MARLSIIPAVKERLEIYLNKCEAAYLTQPEGSRKATLPATGDGKINVRAVAGAIELRQSQEKYLYERYELYNLLNMMAEGQGLLPIGTRNEDPADKALRDRLIHQAKAAKADGQAAVEARAKESALTEQLQAALEENSQLQAQVMRLRAQMEMISAGLLVRIEE